MFSLLRKLNKCIQWIRANSSSRLNEQMFVIVEHISDEAETNYEWTVRWDPVNEMRKFANVEHPSVKKYFLSLKKLLIVRVCV